MIPEESLARLAIAWEACQLSEAARAAVRIDGDPDELLARANEVLRAAERYAATVHAFTSRQAVEDKPAGRRHGRRPGWWPSSPEEAAADLDDWLIHHRDGVDPGPAPISRALKSTFVPTDRR